MILDDIIKNKKREVAALKKKRPLAALRRDVESLPHKKRTFFQALKKNKKLSVIAEIKRMSPSKGIIRQDFDPVGIAREYEKAGATALSVLTDEKFFGGSGEIFKKVRRVSQLPILRKDFILEEYQVYESRLLGADAILLIAAILPVRRLERLRDISETFGLDVLFEVHTKSERDKVLSLKPQLLGINNRDLRTFEVDIHTTERLAKGLPKGVLLVSESGIQNQEDLVYLKSLGAKAVLVGESLMKETDIRLALQRLLKGLDGKG